MGGHAPAGRERPKEEIQEICARGAVLASEIQDDRRKFISGAFEQREVSHERTIGHDALKGASQVESTAT